MRAERGDREGEGTLVVEIRERELGWRHTGEAEAGELSIIPQAD